MRSEADGTTMSSEPSKPHSARAEPTRSPVAGAEDPLALVHRLGLRSRPPDRAPEGERRLEPYAQLFHNNILS